MSNVAPTSRVEWLKQRELAAVHEDAALTARWGEDAADTQQSSLLIDPAAALAEAARQVADVLGHPHVVDVIPVEGDAGDLTGETIGVDYTLRIDRGDEVVTVHELGGGTAVPFLVLGAAYDPVADVTELRGLVRLS